MPDLTGTIRGEIAFAAQRLEAVGTPEPRREALRLWAALAGRAPGEVWQGRESLTAPETAAGFRRAVERVAAGEPLQYVVGSTGFRRLEIACDPRALIPRPETEGLVDLALGLVRTGRALDLGTGTGCIALALADEGDFDDVTAVDLSGEALGLARANGATLGLRVRWLQGNWCEPVRTEQFDVVISNPPYITGAELERLDPGVREWEPRMALDGGLDGLRDVVRLLRDVPGILRPGGWCLMELDSTRAQRSAELAVDAGWHSVKVYDDLFGRPRFLVARRERDHA